MFSWLCEKFSMSVAWLPRRKNGPPRWNLPTHYPLAWLPRRKNWPPRWNLPTHYPLFENKNYSRAWLPRWLFPRPRWKGDLTEESPLEKFLPRRLAQNSQVHRGILGGNFLLTVAVRLGVFCSVLIFRLFKNKKDRLGKEAHGWREFWKLTFQFEQFLHYSIHNG